MKSFLGPDLLPQAGNQSLSALAGEIPISGAICWNVLLIAHHSLIQQTCISLLHTICSFALDGSRQYTPHQPP